MGQAIDKRIICQVMWHFHTVYRLTWLKKRLNSLGLHRKGPRVQYSTISQVQKAIEVQCGKTRGFDSVLNGRCAPRMGDLTLDLIKSSSNPLSGTRVRRGFDHLTCPNGGVFNHLFGQIPTHCPRGNSVANN